MIAKSRVAPMKYTSIPRLELVGAVASTKMSELVIKKGWDLIILWNVTGPIAKL